MGNLAKFWELPVGSSELYARKREVVQTEVSKAGFAFYDTQRNLQSIVLVSQLQKTQNHRQSLPFYFLLLTKDTITNVYFHQCCSRVLDLARQ